MSLDVLSDITVFNSQELFRASVEELGINCPDPRNIDEITNAKKELYKRLKFQYLEQEMKEKFLRMIIDNKPIYVGEKELQSIQQENEVLKNDLKEMKLTNENLLRDLLLEGDEISKQAMKLNTLTESNNSLLSRILELNQQIDSISGETDLKMKEFSMDIDDSVIMTIQKCNQNPDMSVNMSIANSETELREIVDSQTEELDNINQEIINHTKENENLSLSINQYENEIESLQERIKDLQNRLNHAIQIRQNQISESDVELINLDKMGKEITNLLQIWIKLCKFEINFQEITNNSIVININKIKLSINFINDGRLRCFKILKIDGVDVAENFINDCNYNDDCIGYFIKHRLI